MVRLREFVYNGKPRRVYQMVSKDSRFIEGIDLLSMPEEEATKLLTILENFYQKLNPFMKYYRRFSIPKIENDV